MGVFEILLYQKLKNTLNVLTTLQCTGITFRHKSQLKHYQLNISIKYTAEEVLHLYSMIVIGGGFCSAFSWKLYTDSVIEIDVCEKHNFLSWQIESQYYWNYFVCKGLFSIHFPMRLYNRRKPLCKMRPQIR